MTILTIIALILAGIFLLIAEFLIIPGIFIAGSAAVFLAGLGIYMAYDNYGTKWGTVTVIATIIAFFITLYYSLRSKTWKKFMLDSKIDSDVRTENLENKIKTGDSGISITRLNPMGKVKVNDIIVEAKSVDGYINENTEIEVIKVNKMNIIVKSKKL